MAIESEPGQFVCPNCGVDVQVFYSSKTGNNLAWSCQKCRSHGYFKGSIPQERTILIEE